jgi:hypothetical protein
MGKLAMHTKQQWETTARLRHEIDSGRCGDKVCWPDPAAAPLGTDDEAGGTPATHNYVTDARSTEHGSTRRPHAGWVLVVSAALIGGVFIFAAAIGITGLL